MKISVLMPVFNAEKFLKEAIQSILGQTYKNFELIIIDDASTDYSASIIHSLKDKRIKYFKNQKNKGVAYSLNKGLKEAKGELIARMDADDSAFKNRFEKQVHYLMNHQEVGVVGFWVQFIDEKGKKLGVKHYPQTFKELRRTSIFQNPLNHSTVMFRKKLITLYGHYDINLNGAEDYDLWLRLMKHTQIVNIPEVLLKYRLVKGGVSFKNMKQVEMAFLKAKIKSIFKYHYPWWHSIAIIKSCISLIVPSFFRRFFYEKYFNY